MYQQYMFLWALSNICNNEVQCMHSCHKYSHTGINVGRVAYLQFENNSENAKTNFYFSVLKFYLIRKITHFEPFFPLVNRQVKLLCIKVGLLQCSINKERNEVCERGSLVSVGPVSVAMSTWLTYFCGTMPPPSRVPPRK